MENNDLNGYSEEDITFMRDALAKRNAKREQAAKEKAERDRLNSMMEEHVKCLTKFGLLSK